MPWKFEHRLYSICTKTFPYCMAKSRSLPNRPWEEQKPRENAWLLLEQPFSFLKISSKYNSTRELDLSSYTLARLAQAKPAVGSSALQLVGAERYSGTLANCHEVGVAFIGSMRRQTPLGHSKRRIMYASASDFFHPRKFLVRSVRSCSSK